MVHHSREGTASAFGDDTPKLGTPAGANKTSDSSLQPLQLDDNLYLKVTSAGGGSTTVTNDGTFAKESGGNLDEIEADLDSILANQTNGTQVVSTKTDLTPAAPTAVSVGLASTAVLIANANRTGLHVVNTSANRISLAFGAPAVLDNGITLNPFGGAFWMDEFSFDKGAVNAIAAGSSSNLAVQEYST